MAGKTIYKNINNMTFGDKFRAWGLAAGLMGAATMHGGEVKADQGETANQIKAEQVVHRMQQKISDGRPLDGGDEVELDWLRQKGFPKFADNLERIYMEQSLGAQESAVVPMGAIKTKGGETTKVVDAGKRKKITTQATNSEQFPDDEIWSVRPTVVPNFPESTRPEPKYDMPEKAPDRGGESVAAKIPRVTKRVVTELDLGSRDSAPIHFSSPPDPERWALPFFEPLVVGGGEPALSHNIPKTQIPKAESPYPKSVQDLTIEVKEAFKQMKTRVRQLRDAKLNESNWYTMKGRTKLVEGGEDTRLARGALRGLQNRLETMQATIEREMANIKEMGPGQEENYPERFGGVGRHNWEFRNLAVLYANVSGFRELLDNPPADDPVANQR
jgi:hypothetical protein